jgi:hypothetical protein
VKRILLSDGTTVLEGASSSFAIHRFEPGAVLLRATGHDRGELAGAVLAELDAECERFRLPLRLLVDASEVRAVSLRTQLSWTRWLDLRRSWIARVEVATADVALALGIEIAAHRARIADRLVMYTSPATLRAASQRHRAGRRPGAPDSILVSRRQSARELALSDGRCTYRIEDEPGAVRVAIDGFDRGVLGGEAFAALGGLLDGGRKHLAFDLRDALPPATGVADLWSEWLRARRRSITTMNVVCASPRVGLTVSIAAFRAGLGPRLHVAES